MSFVREYIRSLKKEKKSVRDIVLKNRKEKKYRRWFLIHNKRMPERLSVE